MVLAYSDPVTCRLVGGIGCVDLLAEDEGNVEGWGFVHAATSTASPRKVNLRPEAEAPI